VVSWLSWPDSAFTSWLIMLVVSMLLPRPEKLMAGCWYWLWIRDETALELVLEIVLSAMAWASQVSHAQSPLGHATAIPIKN
jgi:hypothetical protein